MNQGINELLPKTIKPTVIHDVCVCLSLSLSLCVCVCGGLDGDPVFGVNVNEIASFVNFDEWRLPATQHTINCIAYIPDPSLQPMIITENSGEFECVLSITTIMN